MRTVKEAMVENAKQSAYVETFESPTSKTKLIKNGGIESVWAGQKRITTPDGSNWQQVAGNTYQKVD